MFEKAYKKLGAALRKQRMERGASQENFAHLMGIARARYGRIERGELNISIKVLFTCAGRLNMKPADLLDDISVDDCFVRFRE